MFAMLFFNIMLSIKQNSTCHNISNCVMFRHYFLKWIIVYKWNECHDTALTIQLNLKVLKNVYQGV